MKRMAVVPLLAVLLGASPAPRAGGPVLTPDVARPGDAVLVRMRTMGGETPRASLAGRPLRFWSRGEERWALTALPLETPPGPVPLELSGGGGEEGIASLEVVDPGFPTRTLQVEPRFVEPPARVRARIARDRRAFAAAYARPFVPPLFSDNFGWPRLDRTTGRFGDQRVLNGKVESVHYGLDIVGPKGSPVRAANDGEVALARDCYYSGKTVVIWHGADLFTLYFHLDRISVRPGAKVRKGQRIGAIGSTGRSTGPHLHWSVRAGGLLVDPESLLGIDFTTGVAPRRRGGPPPHEPPGQPPLPGAPPEAAPASPVAKVVPAGVAPPAAPEPEADVTAPRR